MPWPPKVGEPFPRAEDARYAWSKIEDWILGGEGHGPEWATVFQVGLDDWRLVWEEIRKATMSATIQEVRDRSPHGFACEARVRITLGNRSARVKLSWHYADVNEAPRLVTAYPTL
jgi:hypothetical protein